MSMEHDSMPAHRIIGVAALAEANSPQNRFAGISGVSSRKSRGLLTRARLTARAMTAVPREWLTKAALTRAKACRMPPDIQSKNRELSPWGTHHEGATGKHSTVKDGTNNPKLETNSRRPPADVAAETTPQRCRSQTPALGIAPGKIARRQSRKDFEN